MGPFVHYKLPSLSPSAPCENCGVEYATSAQQVVNAPAAVTVYRNGEWQILLFVVQSDGAIVGHRGSFKSGLFGLPTSSLTWAYERTLASAELFGSYLQSGVSAVFEGGKVYVYANYYMNILGKHLIKEFEWNLDQNNVVSRFIENDSNLLMESDGKGVGVTLGYTPTLAYGVVGAVSQGVVMVTNEPDEAGPAPYASKLSVYRRLSSGVWTPLASPSNERTYGMQPSIAYVPSNSSNPNDGFGRFYISFQSADRQDESTNFRVDRVPRMVFSEGNQASFAASSKRFAWNAPSALIGGGWNHTIGNVPLLFQNGYQTHLSFAYTYVEGGVPDAATKRPRQTFSAYGDNILPGTMRSQDDRVWMQGNLRCSLGKGGCL